MKYPERIGILILERVRLLFKIGEFSKLTQVSIRMLRYYDETGLLKPAVTDQFTNYRLYSAGQIPNLNRIIFLRDLGFTVSEITALLPQWEDNFITDCLVRKKVEIAQRIQAEQNRLAKIELAEKDIRQKNIETHYNVSIKEVAACQVLSLRRLVPDYYAEGQLWKEMAAFAEKYAIPITAETFTIYHDEEFKEENVDIEICVPALKQGEDREGFTFRQTEAVELMACTMVCGPFENIAGAFFTFANWLHQHNQYEMTGQSRQIVHRGPWNEELSGNYLTEIQIPLRQKD